MAMQYDAIKRMLELVTGGDAVLTAGTVFDGIPTIHDVGHRPGCLLASSRPVVHLGFGLFRAWAPDGTEVHFDGGGAMHRASRWSDESVSAIDEKGLFTARGRVVHSFAWCPFTGSKDALESMGYDFKAAKAALAKALAECGWREGLYPEPVGALYDGDD